MRVILMEVSGRHRMCEVRGGVTMVSLPVFAGFAVLHDDYDGPVTFGAIDFKPSGLIGHDDTPIWTPQGVDNVNLELYRPAVRKINRIMRFEVDRVLTVEVLRDAEVRGKSPDVFAIELASKRIRANVPYPVEWRVREKPVDKALEGQGYRRFVVSACDAPIIKEAADPRRELGR